MIIGSYKRMFEFFKKTIKTLFSFLLKIPLIIWFLFSEPIILVAKSIISGSENFKFSFAESFKPFKKNYQKFFFSRKKQQAFLEDISSLVKDGVPAPQAINTIYEISKGSSKYVAKNMLASIAEGKRISESMDFWFASTIVEVIRSGEEGGTLVKTLDAAVKALSQQASAVTSLLGSTLYPVIVFMLAIGVSIFLKHSVFDNFAKIKPVETWPENGQTLLAFATFMEGWWWIVIVIVMGIIFIVRQILTKVTGEIRYFIDEIPLLSLYRFYSAANFMGTLGLLLINGVAFKQAFSIIQRNAPKYVEWHIYMMQQKLSGGKENIADVLDTGMVLEEDILRLKVMAKGKGFANALVSLGEQALERNTTKIKVSGRIFGGLLLAIDAMILMFMIFSVYAVGAVLAS